MALQTQEATATQQNGQVLPLTEKLSKNATLIGALDNLQKGKKEEIEKEKIKSMLKLIIAGIGIVALVLFIRKSSK